MLHHHPLGISMSAPFCFLCEEDITQSLLLELRKCAPWHMVVAESAVRLGVRVNLSVGSEVLEDGKDGSLSSLPPHPEWRLQSSRSHPTEAMVSELTSARMGRAGLELWQPPPQAGLHQSAPPARGWGASAL